MPFNRKQKEKLAEDMASALGVDKEQGQEFLDSVLADIDKDKEAFLATNPQAFDRKKDVNSELARKHRRDRKKAFKARHKRRSKNKHGRVGI